MLSIIWSLYGRHISLAGALATVAIAFSIALHGAQPTTVVLIPLGDANAPRVELATAAPAISAPLTIRRAAPYSVDPNSGPARPSSDRALTATRLPDIQYQAAALAALQCAGNSSIIHDAALDAAAADLWRATVAEAELELAAVAGTRFAYVAAVPVALAPDLEPTDMTSAACRFGGMDFNQLTLDGVNRVGIAVFADTDLNDGMDDSTVMIVGQ